MMRSCMTENTLATVCYLGNFPTPRVQSISDADIIWSVCALWFGFTAVSARWRCTRYSRMQVAAASVPPPINAIDVHRHVLATWKANRSAVTEANCWPFSTDTGTWDMDRGLWQVVQQEVRGRPPAAPISGKRPKRNDD